MASQDAATFAYVGTANGSRGPGGEAAIYVYRQDPASGALAIAGTASGVERPTFLVLHPGRRYLYAVNELAEAGGAPAGAVSAFAVDPSTGLLTYLNEQPVRGKDPCHLSVDATGKFVFVANYSSGSLTVLPILADGRRGEASDLVQHTGSVFLPERQGGPHAHSITIDPTNTYALAADLGLDRIFVYRLDLERGKLIPNDVPSSPVAPGAGPRHLDFHPNGRWVYVINEINNTVTAFRWDAERGRLQEFQAVTTLPLEYHGISHCADVHVSPSGRFLYGSNRVHDSITIYAIDQADGHLSFVGIEPTRGMWPRNFAIEPTGEYLYAANDATNNIIPFKVDPQTGKLTRTGLVTSVPKPNCIKFARLP